MSRILCVDDEPTVLRVLEKIVVRGGHEFVGAQNAAEALHLLQRGDIDLILSDYQLPGIDGLELIEMLRRERDQTPVIMVTAHGGIDHALQAVRAGAEDYLQKPFEPEQLTHRIEQALGRLKLRRELQTLRDELAERRSERRLLGTSGSLNKVRDVIAAAAQSRATVLIEGESGTGKELVAREIHERSDRRERPFIKLNCAALPEGLIESALFGHEKGAFTGAFKRVSGAFERADGGTLLLDEISEMRLDLQAKLLRVLQEREFERVGGSAPIKVDVRIIATTNRILVAEVARGTFRQDLYYRVNVLTIGLPPLRERVTDIPLLAQSFAARMAAESGKQIEAISADAMDLLQRYPWPGNVRELQHAIERGVILARGSVLEVDAFDNIRQSMGDVPSVSAPGAAAVNHTVPAGAITLQTLNLSAAEDALVAEALRVSGGNRTRAAELLGLGVRGLRKKLNPRPRPETE